MARPNVLTFKTGGILQMLSNTEFNLVADTVLEKFAGSDGPGNIYAAQGANADYTSIGVWSDSTTAGEVGDANSNVLYTDFELFQDLTPNVGELYNYRPVIWDSSSQALRACSNAELEDLADSIIDYMVNNEGPGSYRVSTTTPAYSGTWEIVGSIVDKSDPSTITNTYNLYKKISNGTPIQQKPLKIQAPGTLQTVSNTEIQQLTNLVRLRIRATRVGTYTIKQTSPSLQGTWVNVGTITDTRRDLTNTRSYVNEYVNTYTSIARGYNVSYYSDPVTYDGDIKNYIGTYTRDGAISQIGYIAEYIEQGTAYLSELGYTGGGIQVYYAAEFGFTPNYTGPATYLGAEAAYYGSPLGITYTGDYSGAPEIGYAGASYFPYVNPPTGTNSYNGYIGIGEDTQGYNSGGEYNGYLGNFGIYYGFPSYVSTYFGQTIYQGEYEGDNIVQSSNSEIYTTTLWRRIA